MARFTLTLSLAIFLTFTTSVFCQDITNVWQCINLELTDDVLDSFPSDATSSVQNCALAFVKGSVTGDLKTFALPFSDEIRSSEFGIADLNNIPAALTNEFSTLMASISNCTTRLISYSETNSNGVFKVNLNLQRQGRGYNRAEMARLDIVQTNAAWRIVNWDIDE